MAEPQPNSETLSLRRAIRTLHRRRPPESHSSWSALTEPEVDHDEVPRPPSCRRAQPTESAVRLFEKNVNFFQGMFYATLNSALVGVISVLIKILYDVPTLQLTAMRLAGIFVFSLPLVIHSGHHPMGHPSNRVHLVLRATVGLAGLYFRFWSMKLIPLSDVAVILASLPVFVTALARVFLNEPCGVADTLILILTMAGLMMSAKIPLPFMQTSGSREDKPDADKYKGLVFALLSTIFGAAKFLISRTVRHEHHSVTLFMYGFVGVAECVLLSPTEPYVLPRCGLGRVIFTSFTVLSFLEQLVLIKALQMENAGPVSVVIAAMDVVFMFAVELILFGNIPDKYSFTGATLVSVCVFLQMAKKTVTESHEKSLFRKLFYWLAY
ncbi:solute carrier family 35 member G1-like [Rhipicephalus microplus]|uniref:solute carrier family 35 member G1-like n=1 Tax=Rhipicephalus microplus TaxID=6941 RepID=UPI0023765A82